MLFLTLAALLGSTYAACPQPVSITNGGFETGKLAPWSLDSNSNPTTNLTIVSPGYKSAHALRLDFAPAQLIEFDLSQSTTGDVCPGYSYNISYAWNWVNYTGPAGGSGAATCGFSVSTGYTDNAPTHYASHTPGWHTHWYAGVDVYSHCKPADASFVVDVTCYQKTSGGQAEFPPFSMLVDDFKIETLDTPPKKGNC